MLPPPKKNHIQKSNIKYLSNIKQVLATSTRNKNNRKQKQSKCIIV